jgi:mannosyltransferase
VQSATFALDRRHKAVDVIGRARVVWILFLLGAIIRLWILPLGSGFWLDETATAWAIQGNLREIIVHSLQWPSQMPLYSVMEWMILKVGGMHEWILRMPSEISAAAAAWMLNRLAIRLINREAALLATTVFVCSEAVCFAAADARPYALGVFGVTGSSLMLARWFEGQKSADAVVYCLLASLTLHMHYTFATLFVVHAVWAALQLRLGAVAKPRQLLFMAGGILLLMFPAWPHARALINAPGSHSFAAMPNLSDVLALFAPPIVVSGLCGGVFISLLLFRDFEFRSPAGSRLTFIIILVWVIMPVFLMYAVSVVTGVSVFLPRYLLPYVPGLALLVGWLSTIAHSKAGSLFSALLLIFLSIWSAGWLNTSHGGDWRKAVDFVNRKSDLQTPVLLRSGFVESKYADWVNGSPASNYLFAPLTIYPLKGKVIPLPYASDAAALQYLDQVVSTELLLKERFLLLTSGDSVYEYWLDGSLWSRGWVMERLARFGDAHSTLRALRFRRRESHPFPEHDTRP